MSGQDVTLERSYLDRMSAGLGDEGPGLVLEIVDLVLTDTPGRIGELVRCLDAGDLAGRGRVAHGLIGRCGLVGALRLTALCRRLEEDALCRERRGGRGRERSHRVRVRARGRGAPGAAAFVRARSLQPAGAGGTSSSHAEPSA